MITSVDHKYIQHQFEVIEDSKAFGEHTSDIVNELRIQTETIKNSSFTEKEAIDYLLENDVLNKLSEEDYCFDLIRDLQGDISSLYAHTDE